ncbi:NAD-dependent epimerase/dehydratase family protein [Streptomyces platensis]|uniref:NAD-dependent epimerase/dehydratase family protein n=1 Tax=Streptomyces platensis TaxID=58346 RepID=A0AAE6NPC2_STRPT|nr:NAD(P)H-binding protein [Streptomyces platensis]QEV55490.1 NAD-dependent epimerase/dehydratase family protein [Streptomyces platensis]
MPDTTGPRGTPCRSSILVTGAAGNLGREVVDRLQAHGALVRCLVRDQTGPRPGVEWAVGDLTDAAAVRAALVGIDAVFLIWPLLDSAPAHDLVTELVAAAPRVVYLSSTAIDDEAARQSDPIVQVHADMEALLRNAGLRPLVLRSDTLASNARGWAPQLRAGDVVSGPDMARTAVVDERDVADAAVAVLLAQHNPLDYEPHLLTGPEVLSRTDQVALLGAALRRRLRFQAVTADVARSRMLTDGRPERLVEALIAASMRRPESNHTTDHIERLTGRPAGTFARWAVDHAAEFS